VTDSLAAENLALPMSPVFGTEEAAAVADALAAALAG
jgi:hypothetical protein